MAEAYIIDAVRTPRSIGKLGKGALSTLHPQHVAATVLKALKDRNTLNTADVDDIIWGCSAQAGLQGGDMGRMAALDAGYDVRASGVTLDRFCGSGITATSLAAAQVMSGMEDLVIAGGTEMMSQVTDFGMKMREAGLSAGADPSGKAPPVEPGGLRRCDRIDGGHRPRRSGSLWR
jgi:acetyl-CoA C-acetyltransferase